MFHLALSIFRLFDEGLPPIGKRSICRSTVYINKNPKKGGKEAELCENSIVFGLRNLDLSKLVDDQSYILKNLKSNKLV